MFTVATQPLRIFITPTVPASSNRQPSHLDDQNNITMAQQHII
jgi:hypothetical protein